MKLSTKIVSAVAASFIFAAPMLATAKPAQHSSVTTYSYKGKTVGKSITNGNTTRYYQRGKPVGKSIRR